jgi:hypothetical protein
MAKLTAAQAAAVQAAAEMLWKAKLALEVLTDELQEQGVDLDYEHLPLLNATVPVDAAITAFHYFAHNYEGAA